MSETGNGKVVVAYLHPGHCPTHFTESLVRLLEQERRIGAKIDRQSGVNVSHGRNWVVEAFLDRTEHEWLLTLDSDMAFGADLIDRLLAVADPVERPVVAGLYFGHTDGIPYPHMYRQFPDPSDPDRVHSVRLIEYQKGLVEVDGTGAGCMLIHRSVLEKIRAAKFDPAFPWYQETSEINGQPTGEDITFCLRVRKVGHPVYVDTRIVCGHVKEIVIDEALFRAVAAYHAALGIPRGDTPDPIDLPDQGR